MNRLFLVVLLPVMIQGITTAQNKVEKETLAYAVKDGKELLLDK